MNEKGVRKNRGKELQGRMEGKMEKKGKKEENKLTSVNWRENSV